MEIWRTYAGKPSHSGAYKLSRKKYKWAAKATAIPLRNVPRVNTPNSTLDTTQFLT